MNPTVFILVVSACLIYWVYSLFLMLKFYEESKYWLFTRKAIRSFSIFLILSFISLVLNSVKNYVCAPFCLLFLYSAISVLYWFIFVQKGAYLFVIPYHIRGDPTIRNNIIQELTNDSLHKNNPLKKDFWIILAIISLPILVFIISMVYFLFRFGIIGFHI